MKLLKKAGATSEIWQIFVRDSSSTTGAGLTGLVFNSASLTAYYHRDTDTTATAITLVTMTVGTFTSSGFKEIDATNMPGWYQFCPPNAAIASGAKSCAFHLKGATNMAPLPIECQLIAADVDDGVRLGLTALPNAAAEAAGGLYTRGTGAGQINQPANGMIDTNEVRLGGSATPVTNLGTVFNTDFATVYDATNKAFLAKLGNFAMGGSSLALTTGAIACTTITASGAVAFQSTFAVTTSTSLGALSCTTLTASGAVALQSTVTVTAETTFTGGIIVSAGIAVTNSVGHAISATSTGNNGSGMYAAGNGTGDGFSGDGGSTGRGFHFRGGAASGAGARFEALAGNSAGIELVHAGSGKDLDATTTNLTLAKTTNITGFNDITAAAAATGVWTDTTASDFTTALSIGKSVMNGVSLGTGLTVAAVSGAVGSVTASVTVGTNNDKAGYALSASGVDLILIESGIVAGASLTNDSGTQLTSINMRQAISLVMSTAAAGVLAGAATSTITTKPGGLPAGNTRVSATVDANGNRSALTLKVPT